MKTPATSHHHTVLVHADSSIIEQHKQLALHSTAEDILNKSGSNGHHHSKNGHQNGNGNKHPKNGKFADSDDEDEDDEVLNINK